MDWKAGVKAIAPTIGGLLATFGGPAGALGGAALNAVAAALGVPPTEDDVSSAIQAGLTGEQRAALIQADLEYKKAVLATGIEERRLNIESDNNILKDIQDARSHNADTVGVLRLGYLINVSSYICVASVLFGCYNLVQGGLNGVDPILAGSVGALVGSTVQWLLSNAAQANGFFFGSSPASRAITTSVGDNVAKNILITGRRK